jgi:hypothetical protein
MQTENTGSNGRILALEVRSRWTGFAGFELTGHLMEWGRRKYKIKGPEFAATAARRICAIIDLWPPTTIVVRTRTVRSSSARRRIRTILCTVRREAKKRSIEFRRISAKTVRYYFAARHCKSKHQVAALIAQWFPELSWKLPPKRKSWKSEDHRMVIFDAAATALAFLNKSPPEQ